MSTTVAVPCPYTAYTQISTALDKYSLVQNPIDELGDGSRVRVIIAAALPAPTAPNYMTLKPGQAMDKASVLNGHIWVKPESEDVAMIITEAD